MECGAAAPAGQFQIQLDRYGLTQHTQIAILNMASIFTQVNRNPVCASQFRQCGRPDGIGIISPASLPNRRDVIDIDSEYGHRFTCLTLSSTEGSREILHRLCGLGYGVTL